MLAIALSLAAACSNTRGATTLETTGFFSNGDIRLSYRLDLPPGRGPFSAVVVGHGSGRLTKDDVRYFSDRLIARGFAVLRYDKRGVGESTGTYSMVGPGNSEQMFADLAGDMAAGVRFLRGRSDIRKDRVGLLGMSQAGWIIPVAARAVQPAFMIIISGPTVTVGQEIHYSRFAENSTGSLEPAYAALTTFTGMHGFDPVPVLKAIDVPGLWLLGQGDRSIPERDTATILRQLIADGRPFALFEYPDADHSLRVLGQGFVDYWRDIDAWLEKHKLNVTPP